MKCLENQIILGHKPHPGAIQTMAKDGITDIVTILTESEGALDYKKPTSSAGLTWHWLSLDKLGGALDNLSDMDEQLFLHQVRFFKQHLSSNSHRHYYIHGEEGICRTGMFVYALYRMTGMGVQEARQTLRSLRPKTYECLGDVYLQKVDDILARESGNVVYFADYRQAS